MKYLVEFLAALMFVAQLVVVCLLSMSFVHAIHGDWQVKAKLNANGPVTVFCGRNFVDEKGECKK